MKILFIANDPPYGTERVYNALRLAHALVKREPSADVTVFLMADAVLAGKSQPHGLDQTGTSLSRAESSALGLKPDKWVFHVNNRTPHGPKKGTPEI
jgi:sulfur relay (sulfurtransferase) complex TusBCD TusD component (DsrE family)